MKYSERVSGMKSSAIRDILKIISRPGMISFAGGLPAPELFPLQEIAGAARDVFSKFGEGALQYSITEGIVSLREKIAAELDPEGGSINVNNIIITQGSQQGLDLLSKLYIDKGTVIYTENPSYLGALQSFRMFQGDVRSVRSDKDGICIDCLGEAVSACRPALVYLMPNFQNPTGTSLSIERRQRLVELAREHDLLVIEDDPYGELVFDGHPVPSLQRLGGTKNFIRMSSFSKTIAPGLRVAYISGEEGLVSKLALVKQGTDLQTNTLGQYLVNEYLESGMYREHLGVLRKTYRDRRDLMLSSMERHFPGSLKWNRPSGGMFLWVELPAGLNAREILLRCLEHNVAFVPGQEFFPDNSGENTIRLNFSNATPENIEEGIRRIAEILRGMGL